MSYYLYVCSNIAPPEIPIECDKIIGDGCYILEVPLLPHKTNKPFYAQVLPHPP